MILRTMIKVLEIDQFSSSADNLTNMGFKDFELQKLSGGSSEAAKVIFGGYAKVKMVGANERPSIGDVWYVEENGKFKLYLANYDTSD